MALFLISLFAPLLSAAIAGAFSHAKAKIPLGAVCSALIIASASASFMQAAEILGGGEITFFLKDFVKIGNLDVNFSFLIDPVSAAMTCTVTLVASVVHIYSIGYMERDEGFNRYFSYLGLFVFCMLFLVTSDNFVGLFIGWEGVGLCSWLLIGFWYEKSSANAAANEAFVMNRIADLGMLLGLFLLFYETGSLNFKDVFAAVSSGRVDHGTLSACAALLFIGAMGKSAQFPLHTWLANAMEGPTPVSALIHAATMVTAGVYLVVRANEIFAITPEISGFIAALGAFVAVFAASIALIHSDLKKIIAYSTLSQLGYMFVAAGLGAYWIVLFHLVTHAFFKSLLFLCAGNVMHAMHDELNIKKMGGLVKFMRPTAILTGIGSVALAGFYPFAGFFSKDKILEVAFAQGNYAVWFALLAGALMTAFYSFRLIMLVFFTQSKLAPDFHPHEAKNFMLASLTPLAFLAVFAGFLQDEFENFTTRVLPKFSAHLSHLAEISLIILTLALVAISAGFAVWAYKFNKFSPRVSELKIYKILANNYFIPQFYERFIVANYARTAKFCRAIDEAIIDRGVDGVARLINALANVANKTQSGDLSLMLRLIVLGFALLLSFVFLLIGEF